MTLSDPSGLDESDESSLKSAVAEQQRGAAITAVFGPIGSAIAAGVEELQADAARDELFNVHYGSSDDLSHIDYKSDGTDALGSYGSPLDFLRPERQDSQYVADFRAEVRRQEAEFQQQADQADIQAYDRWLANEIKLGRLLRDPPTGTRGVPTYDQFAESPGAEIGATDPGWGAVRRGYDLKFGPVDPLIVAASMARFAIPRANLRVLSTPRGTPGTVEVLGGFGSTGGSGFTRGELLTNAKAPFNSQLTEAGRALSKHPEVVGLDKSTFNFVLRSDPIRNAAGEGAVGGILAGSEPVIKNVIRYGSVIEYQVPNGFGVRFYADGPQAGKFIGFINPTPP